MKLERQSDQWPKRVAAHKQAAEVEPKTVCPSCSHSVPQWSWDLNGGCTYCGHGGPSEEVLELDNDDLIDEWEGNHDAPGWADSDHGKGVWRAIQDRANLPEGEGGDDVYAWLNRWERKNRKNAAASKTRRQASSVGDWWPPVSQDEWGDPLAGAVGDDPMYGGAEDRYREFLNDHVIELTNEEIVDEFDRLSQDPGFEQTPLGQVMSQEMESRAEDAWESSHDPSMWSPKQGARRAARPPVADHAFKPYSDDPERCVAELSDSGDTCNQLVEKHQMVPGEVLRDLRARGVFGSRRQAGDDPLGTCDGCEQEWPDEDLECLSDLRDYCPDCADEKEGEPCEECGSRPRALDFYGKPQGHEDGCRLAARRQAVRVRIDTRLLHQLDDDRNDDGTGGAEELEFGSEAEALEHLNNLAADWDTDLVPAKGYVDYDGGDYDDEPDGTTYIFNGPVTDQERQGFATILHGSRRQAVRVEIDRHLIDEEYLEEQQDSGTHLLNPEKATKDFGSPEEARAWLEDAAADWGCQLGDCGDGLLSFDGPEDEEVQGEARIIALRGDARGRRPFDRRAAWSPDPARPRDLRKTSVGPRRRRPASQEAGDIDVEFDD